ncbi:MAG: protein kinase, partial [Deltaproteobacteria bacterium]|nr:protein kinase [Deltaproteobacteria bacterium]
RNLSERLRLLPHFRDLCNAIAYAHGRGVIHRDLKPGNVLVGAFGETVVVDWGLARMRGAPADVTEPALQSPIPGMTLDGTTLGTPGYMSPEQAAGRLDEVDERSDVFSLGAVLFELLMGRPPFTGKSDEEILKAVIAGPQERTSLQGVPPDLAAVAQKALSHERAERYANAGALESDIAAWSEGRTVAVYRYSPWQLFLRTAARHRATFAALTVTVIVGAVWAGNVWGRNQELRHQRAAAMLERAYNSTRHMQWDRAAAYFAEARVAEDKDEARWGESLTGLTGLVPRYKLIKHTGRVRDVAFAPDGKSFASGGDDRTLRVFDDATGSQRLELALPEAPLDLAYSPDGRTLLAAIGDGLQLFDAATGEKRAQLDHGGPVSQLALAADGALAATVSGSTLLVWDLPSRKVLARHNAEGAIDAIAFLRTDEVVYGGRSIQGVRRWNPRAPDQSPEAFGPPMLHARQLVSCPSPRLLMGDHLNNVAVWNFGDGKVEPLQIPGGDCRFFAVSADCRTLGCIGDVGAFRLWDVDSRQPFVSLAGSFRQYTSAAISSDGEVLIGAADRALRLWAAGASSVHRGSRGPGTRGAALAWSADGTRLVSIDRGGALELWDPKTGKFLDESRAHEGAAYAIAAAPSGTSFASAGEDGLLLWDGWKALRSHPLAQPTRAVAFDPTGTLVAAGTENGAVHLVALAGGPVQTWPAHRDAVRAIAFSRDGKKIASAGSDGLVLLWDARTLKLLARLEGHEDEVRALVFSLDGKELLSGSADRRILRWDVKTGAQLGMLHSFHSGEIDSLAIAPQVPRAPASGLLFSASSPGMIELWDLRRGRPVSTMGLPPLVQTVSAAFSPDAQRLALLRNDGVLQMQEMTGPANLKDPEADRDAIFAYYKYETDGPDFIRNEILLVPPAEHP